MQKAYQHVANQRKDFQHKLSTQLVQNFGMIAVEDLNIKSLSAGILAKAENAGRQLVKVDPKYTSQECPNCHALEKKPLSERVHRCDCGLTIGRDHAAAFVILGRGLRLQAQTMEQSVLVA